MGLQVVSDKLSERVDVICMMDTPVNFSYDFVLHGTFSDIKVYVDTQIDIDSPAEI